MMNALRIKNAAASSALPKNLRTGSFNSTPSNPTGIEPTTNSHAIRSSGSLPIFPRTTLAMNARTIRTHVRQ